MRIEDTVAGFSQLMSMLSEQQRCSAGPITVAIETAKGLLPAALRAAGVPLIAINPLAVSRYRDRHSPSRAKSDAGDALVLANILRTDPHTATGRRRATPSWPSRFTCWPAPTRMRSGTGCR